MSFDLTLARTNLLAWATANYGGGLGTAPVVWRNTPQDSSYLGPGRIALDLVHQVGVGWDEVIYTDAVAPPAGEELDVTIKISRQVTLAIRIEIQDQRATTDAFAYSQRLQDSLRFPSTRDLFSAAGLAFRAILSERDLTSVYQQRLHSACQLDIGLNMGYTAADAATTYIEHMEYDTDYKNPDGSTSTFQDSGTLDLT